MCGGMEGGSPALAAPGPGDYRHASNRLAEPTSGRKRALSQEEADDFCLRYRPLALKIASQYFNRGIEVDDLCSAGMFGLVLATKKFYPDRGVPFGGYAKFWIKGQILELFKPKADALGLGRGMSLTLQHAGEEESHQRDIADTAPTIAPDLSALSDREVDIVAARDSGETLREIGLKRGISSERVRQLEVRARSKVKGSVASACVSDLTQRGKVIRFPIERTRHYEEFQDREPPRHVYSEPKPSREVVHHRAKAPGLAELRGNEPLRSSRDLGPVIHGWRR